MTATFTWKPTLLSILLITLLIIVSGWLISKGILPLKSTIGYSDIERQFIQVWIWIAVSIGLLLPGVAFLLWFNHPELRRILGFYLLTLVVQIASEQVLSSLFVPSLVVIIGTVYTGFRLWQLWQGQQLLQAVDTSSIASGLLWLLILFWGLNMVQLLAVGWRRVL